MQFSRSVRTTGTAASRKVQWLMRCCSPSSFQAALCFCNDCRKASGGLVLFGLMVPFAQANFSLLRHGIGSGEDRMNFLASDHLPPKESAPLGSTTAFYDTYLSWYQSSEKAVRAFCSVRYRPHINEMIVS